MLLRIALLALALCLSPRPADACSGCRRPTERALFDSSVAVFAGKVVAVDKKTITLEAWDVGTDSATSYRAFDDDTRPRAPIQLNAQPYFVKDGKRVPVGTVTFVRQ